MRDARRSSHIEQMSTAEPEQPGTAERVLRSTLAISGSKSLVQRQQHIATLQEQVGCAQLTYSPGFVEWSALADSFG